MKKINSIGIVLAICLGCVVVIPQYMQVRSHKSISQAVSCQEKINQLVWWTLSGAPYKVHACVTQLSNAQKRLIMADLKTMLEWFYTNYGGEDKIKRMIGKQERREFWGTAAAFAGGIGAAILSSYASENNAPGASVAAVGGLGSALVGSAIAGSAGLQAEDIKVVLAHVQSIEHVLSIVESSYRPGALEKFYNKVAGLCSGLCAKANPKQTVCSIQVASVAVGKKSSVTKVLRKLNPELSNKAAKELLEKIPVVIQENVDEKNAQGRKEQLEKAGATITLVYQ